MSSAISDDIIKYKRTHSLTCNDRKTNTEVYENYHVDHDNPSFQTLKDIFLQLTTKQIPTSFTDCKKFITLFLKRQMYILKRIGLIIIITIVIYKYYVEIAI